MAKKFKFVTFTINFGTKMFFEGQYLKRNSWNILVEFYHDLLFLPKIIEKWILGVEKFYPLDRFCLNLSTVYPERLKILFFIDIFDWGVKSTPTSMINSLLFWALPKGTRRLKRWLFLEWTVSTYLSNWINNGNGKT